MIWEWDPEKARTNLKKHGISFSTATLVFLDPLLLSWPDPHSDGDRWVTIGKIRSTVVYVVHTLPKDLLENNQNVGRIITARKSTVHERRAYETSKWN